MTLHLVHTTKVPAATGTQGNEWHCAGCGCTILRGSVAGAKVLQGELNMDADSCHTSNEMRCAGCDAIVAMKVKGRWKTVF